MLLGYRIFKIKPASPALYCDKNTQVKTGTCNQEDPGTYKKVRPWMPFLGYFGRGYAKLEPSQSFLQRNKNK
jgi:hypothetical protein